MCLIKTKIFTIVMLMFCMSIFCVPTFASDGGEEVLTLNAAFVEGDMLRISVTDVGGKPSALVLRLTDYINKSENSEYISVKAVDTAGNQSGVIQIKNPYYVAKPQAETDKTEAKPSETVEAVIPIAEKPFTPDGTSEVTDNAKETDGKEFFTIGTEDGNVFYLVVDRQKATDNVYLLNAVTENDLMALAEKNGKTVNNGSTSAIETPTPTEGVNEIQPTPTPVPESKPPVNDYSSYILVAVVVLAVGGAGYYFKIVRGKKNTFDAEDEDDEDDFGYENEMEENDDEEVGDVK